MRPNLEMPPKPPASRDNAPAAVPLLPAGRCPQAADSLPASNQESVLLASVRRALDRHYISLVKKRNEQ